jgi:molecular chaperone GrpE
MTTKKNIKTKTEETPDMENAPVTENHGAGGMDQAAEIEALRTQLAESQSKATEYLDGWQRSQADFANYKRRTDQEKAAFYTMSKGDVYKRVLPVLDDLERALQNRVPGDAWANGIELVARKFQNILEAEGITRIEAEGQVFDPNLHEAISQEASEEYESGVVIAVVQQGYMMGDRVIRHALVRVAA